MESRLWKNERWFGGFAVMRRCGDVVEWIDFDDKSNGINAVENLGTHPSGRCDKLKITCGIWLSERFLLILEGTATVNLNKNFRWLSKGVIGVSIACQRNGKDGTSGWDPKKSRNLIAVFGDMCNEICVMGYGEWEKAFADRLILAFCAVSGWSCGQCWRCLSQFYGGTEGRLQIRFPSWFARRDFIQYAPWSGK